MHELSGQPEHIVLAPHLHIFAQPPILPRYHIRIFPASSSTVATVPKRTTAKNALPITPQRLHSQASTPTRPPLHQPHPKLERYFMKVLKIIPAGLCVTSTIPPLCHSKGRLDVFNGRASHFLNNMSVITNVTCSTRTSADVPNVHQHIRTLHRRASVSLAVPWN
jgi:hypothetical protein